MLRWKFVTLASLAIVVLSVGGAILTARYDGSPNSVDFQPLGPILLGAITLLALWVAAFIEWIQRVFRDAEARGSDEDIGDGCR